jgi:hypothetical protein
MMNHVVNGAADGDDPARTRWLLTWMQQASDDGPHPVRAHEQVTLRRLGIAEVHGHACGTLREPLGFVVNGDGVRSDGFEERSMQRRPQRDRHPATHRCGYWYVGALDHGAIHPPQFDPRVKRSVCAGQHDVSHAKLGERPDGIGSESQSKPQLARR